MRARALSEFTAFLMTLRRKNLAPHGPLVTTYGAMLTSGFVISTIDHSMNGCWLMVNTLATSAAILRLGLGIPKYVMWGGLATALHFLRPHLVLAEGDGKSVAARVGVLVGLTAVLVAIGAKKIANNRRLTMMSKGWADRSKAIAGQFGKRHSTSQHHSPKGSPDKPADFSDA